MPKGALTVKQRRTLKGVLPGALLRSRMLAVVRTLALFGL